MRQAGWKTLLKRHFEQSNRAANQKLTHQLVKFVAKMTALVKQFMVMGLLIQ